MVIPRASWELYEQLLVATQGQNLRITYDDGALEITSPLPEHKAAKKVIGGFIEAVVLDLRLPMRRMGSTTLQRKSLRKGAEADECYYIQHAKQMHGKKRVDLRRDPPPDLVLEVDLTHRTPDKRRVYAAMGAFRKFGTFRTDAWTFCT